MIVLISLLFIVGYAAIALERPLRIDKAASALVTAVLCWVVYALFTDNKQALTGELSGQVGKIAGILFFLLGAMVIVELIDAHDGFGLITERIRTTNKKKLLWLIGFLTFFLSAVLDNLTTAIVVISLLRKLVPARNDRLLFTGLVVIAANAGGAWSPIGDVTTTMLWIGGQITAGNIVLTTFLPSLVCLIIAAFLISRQLTGNIGHTGEGEKNNNFTGSSRQRNAVFWTGIGSLLFVPVFKTITHLPPYMGILLGLGLLWILTAFMHGRKNSEEKGSLSVNQALRKIDTSSILFFLGILLSIGTLDVTGILGSLARWMDHRIGNINVITIAIGLGSAIVDNVPLVASAQGMYSLEQYPTDHSFWPFLAYCAGTGGSCLIIGSAAGIAAMGLEKIEFFWYLRKIGWIALIAYLAGAAVFLLQEYS